jgi:hypothetical protein
VAAIKILGEKTTTYLARDIRPECLVTRVLGWLAFSSTPGGMIEPEALSREFLRTVWQFAVETELLSLVGVHGALQNVVGQEFVNSGLFVIHAVEFAQVDRLRVQNQSQSIFEPLHMLESSLQLLLILRNGSLVASFLRR